jgi:membrane protease YdiL (CAAX protease family)
MEFETKPIRRHFNSLGLMYFFGTLLIFGVQYAEVFLIERLPLTGIYDTDVWLLISTVPMYLISMPLMMLLIRRVPAVSVEKHPITFLQWLTAFFMCYAIMYLGNLVGLGLTFVIGMVKGSPVDNALVDIATDISPWTALVIMVLCAPVFEELIFRKLLIDRTVKYGEKTAVLFSGIFFGLFHGNLNQFAYAFGLGIFWGFIYVKTGKIRYSICMHMAVNFLGSVASVFLLKSAVYEELIAVSASGDMGALMGVVSEHLPGLMLFGLYGLAMLGFLITGIVCLAVHFRKMKLKSAELPLPKGKLMSAAFLNAGVALFSLFWIIQILLQLMG